MRDCVCAEWIEEHSSAAAPLANYAPNHLETYRDPQVPPTLPPGPAGVKRKSLCLTLTLCSFLLFDFYIEFLTEAKRHIMQFRWKSENKTSNLKNIWIFFVHLHWKFQPCFDSLFSIFWAENTFNFCWLAHQQFLKLLYVEVTRHFKLSKLSLNQQTLLHLRNQIFVKS